MKITHAPALIGLAGRGGVGKDTLARWISSRYGHEVKAFADPLRKMLNQRFGWSDRMWEDREWKENVSWKNECGMFSPRQWMQWLGTDILREYAGYDIFVRLAFSRWDRTRHPMVLTDIRFANEAEAIIERGGFVINITREDAPKVSPHVSESWLDPKLFHGVIRNDGSISDLYEAARILIEGEGARLAMQQELDLEARP